MATVKIEINGKRITADSNQTILEVARRHGIHDIPTLCHDDQLEPFASCFVCVVKVQGARTLVPSCSTKVTNGMIIETMNDEIRRARKAALELLLSNHYADCIGPCQIACPAQVDIQGYIALAAIGKYEDAINLIKETNPLPSICGRICTRPCEVKGCRRSMLDEAVGIDYIKRYVADIQLGKPIASKKHLIQPNGKRIAIVGAGPAGLSNAYYLALKGYNVDIFEAMPEAGGMLRYGIPQYRLPKEILDLEISQILDLGVKLHTNMKLGEDFTLTGLKAQGYDAIYLGLGAWDSSKMRVKGEESEGVLSGIDFLKNFGLRKKINIYGTVAVVGGGNTAIDCARTALRLGVKEVKILYRRTKNEMPANDMEIHEAEQEGVQMEFLVAPVRVLVNDQGRMTGLECVRMELGEPDASGRRSPKPIKGSEFVIPCDFAISAIGQSTTVAELVDGHIPDFLPKGEVLNLTRWQTIAVNEKTFETSVEGVFAGGDAVTGAATAIEAIAAGRKAAYAMDFYIRTGKAKPEPVPYYSRKDTYRKVDKSDLKSLVSIPKRSMPVLPPTERIKSFDEVERGYTLEDVKAESKRCLECGCFSAFDCDLRNQATEYGISGKFSGEAKEYARDITHPYIELDQNKCVLCGRCVRMCSEIVGVSAYGFVHRGFNTVVRPSLGKSLLDTDCVSCGLCIGTCPTGAIIPKIPLEKPGPWKTTSVPTVCHYCGVGCNFNYEIYGDAVVMVSRDEHNTITLGHHCKKGVFGYAYLHDNTRLKKGRIRTENTFTDVNAVQAIKEAAKKIREFQQKYHPNEFAVFVSPRLTNEEIYLTQKLARMVLQTHQIGSFSYLLNPDVFTPDIVSTATYADLTQAQAIVVINSETDTEHFTADLMIKKAVRNGAALICIGDHENRTSRFATHFLNCKPGTQVEVMLALLKEYSEFQTVNFSDTPAILSCLQSIEPDALTEKTGVPYSDIRKAAQILANSGRKVVVMNKDYRGLRHAGDNRLIARYAQLTSSRLLCLNEKSNMQGLLDMGAHPSWFPGYLSIHDNQVIDHLEKIWRFVLRDLPTPEPDLMNLIRNKKIKVALIIGEDPLGHPHLPADLREGLLGTEYLITADLFMTETAKASHIVLPLSAPAETSGTFTNSERRIQKINRAVPAPLEFETWQTICQFASDLGHRFRMNYESPQAVFEEIRKTVPVYQAVNPDAHDGLWNLKEFTLPMKEASFPTGNSQPLSTIDLDVLEIIFRNEFERKFKEARSARS